MIGPSTRIFDDTQIVRSVVGQNCSIGPGTVVRDSYIFDGTSVGPRCVIENSIIAAGVTIKENTKIPRGCLIGDDVVLGPNAVLQPFERLSKKRNLESDTESDDSDLEEAEASRCFHIYCILIFLKIRNR